MSATRRRFTRPTGIKRYRKLFVVAVEGAKTEPHYFKVIDELQSDVRVQCLTPKHKSSPIHVLKTMTNHLNEK